MSRTPILICFAGDVWDGNPHSRHHLMRRFAGSFEVLFVESVPMRGPALRDPQDWRRFAKKLKLLGPRLHTASPGLHVLRPPPIPPAGPIGRRLQLLVLRKAVESALHILRLDGPRVVWFSQPVAAPLQGHLGERASLLYYQDRYDAFIHVDQTRVRDLLMGLARKVDVCIATATELAQDLRALGVDPIVVTHGVEVDRFRIAGPEPADLAEFERPLVGCVGLVDDYWDLAGLRMLADRLERGTLVIIGRANVNVSALEHPRIRLLGSRPYETIPTYLNSFRCCLIPFRVTRLTEGVNPIKLREYLAAGRPVVATPLPELRSYDDVVIIAEPGVAFADAVLETLRLPDDEATRRRRRERVADESWDSVAATIGEILHDLLALDVG
jgi:glycosyltransferase involved in cell wall biosynthesis